MKLSIELFLISAKAKFAVCYGVWVFAIIIIDNVGRREARQG
jgi:hypothetical protein